MQYYYLISNPVIFCKILSISFLINNLKNTHHGEMVWMFLNHIISTPLGIFLLLAFENIGISPLHPLSNKNTNLTWWILSASPFACQWWWIRTCLTLAASATASWASANWPRNWPRRVARTTRRSWWCDSRRKKRCVFGWFFNLTL